MVFFNEQKWQTKAISIFLIIESIHGFANMPLDGIHKSCQVSSSNFKEPRSTCLHMASRSGSTNFDGSIMENVSKMAAVAFLSAGLLFSPFNAANAEDELAAKYGGKGFDSSLVDQTCLVDKCSLQAKACLADDPDCRKGLTCTAKCLGDNSCITGCFARYGNANLDNVLKCTIEDHECIKVAILDGGEDKYGEEPRSIAPTIKNFNLASMEGSWYKVVGFNPNYDCYACQKNSFETMVTPTMFGSNKDADKLQVDVEFSMPKMLPDGSPPPPKNEKEKIFMANDGLMVGSQSIALNDYATHETMVFDKPNQASQFASIFLGKGDNKQSYARTAHSEGEMFGLKFWENWYVIGENDPDQPEFKFVYYNGKTRQNTYEGAFVYSRTKELGPEAMKKVYKIADEAGMNPDNFCKIRNGCFRDEDLTPKKNGQEDPFRSIIASTKISQLLGVEPVAAENTLLRRDELRAIGVSSPTQTSSNTDRAWWYEVGDYLENPHRHFDLMDSLRVTMDWPDYVKNQQ